jgi:hypothetical protein
MAVETISSKNLGDKLVSDIDVIIARWVGESENERRMKLM